MPLERSLKDVTVFYKRNAQKKCSVVTGKKRECKLIGCKALQLIKYIQRVSWINIITPYPYTFL